MKTKEQIKVALEECKEDKEKVDNGEGGNMGEQFDSESYINNEGWIEALEWVLR